MPTVLITGANRGIGAALVQTHLRHGWQVLACARKRESLQGLSAASQALSGSLQCLVLDVRDIDAGKTLARHLLQSGVSLDRLIHNAGMLVPKERFGAVQPEALKESFETNAAAPFLLTQSLVETLARPTQVLVISSVMGSIQSRDDFFSPSYCMSKAAANMGVKLLCHALRDREASCFAIHPGWVQTDMGGAQAPLAPEQSAQDLYALFARLRPEQSGGFFAHTGHALPW
jgi:NAD(P)-dependent dehydrogenase (short-subunit alcohol dehydrogenase family)